MLKIGNNFIWIFFLNIIKAYIIYLILFVDTY